MLTPKQEQFAQNVASGKTQAGVLGDFALALLWWGCCGGTPHQRYFTGINLAHGREDASFQTFHDQKLD